MLINLRVKTLDAQTHDFSIDNELTIRQFKDKIAEKTNIAADQQRIIYCGRVLADEKQLKEYDVDGKVVHVAERPPPSQRGPSTSSSSSNDTPPTRERTSNRGGMRNSPLFRALDGMVVGTMAIPMNPVQNNSPQQGNPFAASSSFCMNRITVARHMLECANNIAAYLEDPERGLNNTSLDILARGSWTMESTVVEVGFTAADLPQNQNLVEMVQDAVSAALRRNSNTNVTVVQLPTVFGSSEGGEADAALGTVDAATNMDATEDSSAAEAEGAAAVIIEDVIDDAFEGGATGANDSGASEASNANNTNNASLTTSPTASDNAAAAAADTSNASTNTSTNTEENQSRRRTNTRVLAEVVEQMRTVQIRLNPFIQQFYELLNNDPTFEEEDTRGRENAQRLYNRVSEALHYMSHAQHAISDLMLDVSQPAPRFLTCRPILVEQSGYVSSNNYLSTAAAAVAAATGNNQARPRSRTFISPRYNHPVTITTNSQPTTASGNGTANGDNTTANVSSNNSGSGGGTGTNGGAADNRDGNSTTANASGSGSGSSIEDPVDEPLTNPNARGSASAATNAATQSNDGSTLEIVLQPRRGLYFGNNPQVQMSRLIQAMVNSAPINTELHVQILPPTIVSVPVSARVAAGNNGNSEQRAQTGASTGSGGTATGTATATSTSSNNSATNNSNNNSARATANASNANSNLNSNNSGAAGILLAGNTGNRPVSASLAIGTLPTTSTQTRSTSRPQLQIGGIPANGWNGRFIPANMMSSFDRFLPCNSHHIREPENSSNGNGGNGGNGANGTNANANAVNANTNSTTNNSTPQIIAMNTLNAPRPRRTFAEILANARATATASAGDAPTSTNANVSAGRTNVPTSTLDQIRNLLYGTSTSNPSASSIPATSCCRLQAEFRNFFAEQIFYNTPINDQTLPALVDSTIVWMNRLLVRLPEYELPEVDSRKSVANIVRLMLPLFVETVIDEQCNMREFEDRMTKICKDFIMRLYSVFNICVGRSNADEYWPRIMSMFLVLVEAYFSDEALRFLKLYFRRDIPSSVEREDAQQFIVYRNSTETDVEMENVEASSSSEVNNRMQFSIDIDNDVELEPIPDEPLPSVTVGTDTWHRNFPEDWLPAITRDLRAQRDNPPNQPPFSDAYISGMSSKRKKMIQNNKPPTNVSALIARSVRKAIQTVGPPMPATTTVGAATTTTVAAAASTSAAALTAEEITEAIANDTAVQTSCTETVRTNVRERLKKDSDYKAEKFPHAAKFVNK